MTDIELELQIAEVSLREAEEAFTKLREDYHDLRVYTDALEEILKNHGIEFPEFCGW